jgi:hypothetical protein
VKALRCAYAVQPLSEHLRKRDPVTQDSSGDIGVSRRLIPINGALRALLRARMDALDIHTYRQLADLSGGGVSHGSVHRILAGQQSSMRPATLMTLADILDVAPAELLAAAGRQHGPWTLPEAFDTVALGVRPVMERALASLLRAGGIL